MKIDKKLDVFKEKKSVWLIAVDYQVHILYITEWPCWPATL
jgi:hypothetical protein